ncbi:hypothetical protein FKM82_023136 [Ascaphus truei]
MGLRFRFAKRCHSEPGGVWNSAVSFCVVNCWEPAVTRWRLLTLCVPPVLWVCDLVVTWDMDHEVAASRPLVAQRGVGHPPPFLKMSVSSMT